MIAHLRGRILEKHPARLVVDVGGVGYEVLVPLPVVQAAGDVGAEIALHTVLVVREDALTLYGFSGASERSLFLKLLTVSGIGPKIALGALSGSSAADLVLAIRDQNLTALTRLPGVGKKTAERMSLELKDALVEFEAATRPGSPESGRADAVAALVSLGYSRPAAQVAVDDVARETRGASAEFLVRAALGRLVGAKPRN